MAELKEKTFSLEFAPVSTEEWMAKDNGRPERGTV